MPVVQRQVGQCFMCLEFAKRLNWFIRIVRDRSKAGGLNGHHKNGRGDVSRLPKTATATAAEPKMGVFS